MFDDDVLPNVGSYTGGLRHVALEFGPVWEGVGMRFHLIEATAFEGCFLDTLWFVDYSLRRTDYIPSQKEVKSTSCEGESSRAIFQRLNFRFVEVLEGEVGCDGGKLWVGDGEAGGNIPACHSFVKAL